MKQPIIPDAALQQHIAVLGKNGSGKTYATKAVIVEPLLEAGKHCGLVDPTSAWWGLRTSRDGKGAGYKVIVLGGDHGDLPLPANGGAAVARLMIEQRVNVVCDTGHFTVGERTRWMIDFAGSVYRLNRAPLHLVLDEAHVFAPQGKVPDPDTGKMLHAVNQLASGGRSRGIRLTMITQRPQKLHKDSLTTADTLIAMRVLAPHDREAVKAWIDGCGDPAQGKEVLDSLAGLKRGEGWVWYPEGGHLIRTKFPAIKTFDSSATPQDGHVLPSPKGAAEIDLTEIRAALADAVKEAEANDPSKLRAQIAQLRADLAKAIKNHSADLTPSPVAVAAARQEGREEGARDGYAAGLMAMSPYMERMATLTGALQEHVDGFHADLKKLTADSAKASQNIPELFKRPRLPERSASAPRPREALQRAPAGPADTNGVTGAKQRILDALAWLEAVRIDRADKTQLALLADQSPTSSGYANNLGALRSAGLIEYPAGGQVQLTAAGRDQANAPLAPPTTAHLHDTLMRRLPGAQWRILETLIVKYPNALDRSALADLAGQSSTSSGYANNLGALRSLGFIDYPNRGEVIAKPVLFLEGR